MVRLCAAVVLLAAPGLLAMNTLAGAAVMEAANHGTPIHILAPPGTEASAGSAGGVEMLWSGQSRDTQVGGAEVVDVLTEQAKSWLTAAWEKRIPFSAPDQQQHLLVEMLGLPDAALQSFPLDALRKVAVERTGNIPDLQHLNSPRLTSLKVRLSGSSSANIIAGSTAVHNDSASMSTSSSGLAVEHLLALIKGNTTLTSLSISGCSVEQAKAVAEAVSSNPTSAISSIICSTEVPLGPLLGRGTAALNAIDLSQAQSFSPEDCTVLCVGLQSPAAASLRAVHLPLTPSPRFRSSAQQALGHLVQTLVNLPSLLRINGVDLAAVSTSLSAGTGEGGVLLDLAGHALGPIGAGVLLSRLSVASAAQGNPLHPSTAAATAPPASLSGGLAAVQALNLTGCGIGAEGAEQLAKATASTPGGLKNLRQLCLADNQLGSQGVTALGRLLSGSTTGLEVLDVSVNMLEDAGAKALALRLSNLADLTVLAMTDNGIKSEGAKALSASLTALQKLEDLLLSGNYLGDAGVASLAEPLGSLPCLKRLHLQNNYSISGEGSRALASLLSSSQTLEQLHLGRNSLGMDGARQLSPGLAASR
ncbi:hypothetical protein CEUSTIGMA_g1994.t1 [Chlamydomonas eustigma]|uniref:Uncharacterized protein n=1 Tax=Chlamydomonas eustigma TaxID=1157962 RepID=A0A250WUN4_9CHLO|nr:hypothetical protein CEUSTIGMA_g1994.t1 [Chlamydomonas eustigma]|eukprot:GAX74544.1 hypothetical protein CEUSTIGMA_g1994.t1 [Chlamydomonas eustigma]